MSRCECCDHPLQHAIRAVLARDAAPIRIDGRTHGSLMRELRDALVEFEEDVGASVPAPRREPVSKNVGWFEEYSCGCTSPRERLKRELPGYCPTHGANRRNVYRETDTMALHVRRDPPESRGDVPRDP